MCSDIYSPRDAAEMRVPLLFRNENAQKVRRREHDRNAAAEMTIKDDDAPTRYRVVGILLYKLPI